MQQIFGFIIHPIELGVVWVSVAVGSAGVGIILFTIMVRVVLAPLLIVQLRSAKAMQRLQPQMAELKKKHGKDKQALSQATMALYREHRVNPAMGCLPTLLQFPILIGLFYGLRDLATEPSGYPLHTTFKNVVCNGFPVRNLAQWQDHCYRISGATSNPGHIFDLFHANFLWLSNGLGAHDPTYILPVLAGVSQWVQSRMMLGRAVDEQQKMMNSMMNFMPLMIVFFAANYASGLSLYWVTSTLIGIAIQYRITGLGLLPETLAGLAARVKGSATRPTPPKRTPPAARQAVPKKQPEIIEATPIEPATEIEMNGKDGKATGMPNGTGPRPRRQANRARGGKRGGRRG